MMEEPHLSSVHDELRRAINELDQLAEPPGVREFASHREATVLARALRTLLIAAASSLGECQEDIPYSSMRPIRRPDGTLEWCCNHHPEHCSPN